MKFQCIFDYFNNKEFSGSRNDCWTLCNIAKWNNWPETEFLEALFEASLLTQQRDGKSIETTEIITRWNQAKREHRIPPVKCYELLQCPNFATCKMHNSEPMASRIIGNYRHTLTGNRYLIHEIKEYEDKTFEELKGNYLLKKDIEELSLKHDPLSTIKKNLKLDPEFVRNLLLELQEDINTQMAMKAVLDKQAKESETNKQLQENMNSKTPLEELLALQENGISPASIIFNYTSYNMAGYSWRTQLMIYAYLVTISPSIKRAINNIRVADSSSGKDFENDVALKGIPEECIVNIKQTTKATLKARAREDSYYYDNKIINMGDLGGTVDLADTEDVRNIFKSLASEGEARFEQVDKEDFDIIIESLLLGHPCLTYGTPTNSKNIDSQEISRGFLYHIVNTYDIVALQNKFNDVMDKDNNYPGHIALQEMADKLKKYYELIGALVQNTKVEFSFNPEIFKDTRERINILKQSQRVYKHFKAIVKIYALLDSLEQIKNEETIVITKKHVEQSWEILSLGSEGLIGLTSGAMSLILDIKVAEEKDDDWKELLIEEPENDWVKVGPDTRFEEVIKKLAKNELPKTIFTVDDTLRLLRPELSDNRVRELLNELARQGYLLKQTFSGKNYYSINKGKDKEETIDKDVIKLDINLFTDENKSYPFYNKGFKELMNEKDLEVVI